MKEITLKEMARILNAELVGDGRVVVTGVRPLDEAMSTDLSFLSNPRYRSSLETTRAGGIIVSPGSITEGKNLLIMDDPYFGFALAMEAFFGEDYIPSGISTQAFIHAGAGIGSDPSIHPFAVVEKGAVVGDRVTLMSGVFVGRDAVIGDDTVLHPHVVVEKEVVIGSRVIIHAGTVVGSDGFGFAREGKRHRKIIQSGIVRIGDDVEIGANCAVDRAVMGETVIGNGCIFDNLIQIAHNVMIGENVILVGQSGIAGSSTLGDNAIIAAQSGVAGHLKIGEGAIVASKTAVLKDVPPGTRVAGIPAVDIGKWKRSVAMIKKLDSMGKRIRAIEKMVGHTAGGETEETE